ncbi:glutamate synthase subunit beta [Thermoleophilia bacterium SCSIO 60948]|nr:glutamate synthase subunit beta [Thermoleophilia bacterium SCSIO 60948]
MPDPRGFLEVERVVAPERPASERVADYAEIYETLPDHELSRQASRCMDCGVPFCNNACPLGNLIPDWNDLVRADDWRAASEQLHATNNFPEFTGLICPAPCESACVLDIDDDPVMIKQIELGIVQRAFEEGWIVPAVPEKRTGQTVGIIGSGPAGLAAADELNRVGHTVTVYERDEAPGGLLRFGVPDAKLEKWMIDRRVAMLERGGIRFECDVDAGVDVSVEELRSRHDALLIAVGSRVERPLDVPGSDLEGVHFAMEYLYGRNRAVARSMGQGAPAAPGEVSAAGKRVIVIGGGDTGMDCISNALREGATDAVMLDVYPEVPEDGRYADTPWPLQKKRTFSTYALDEGGERRFGNQVIRLEGDGRVQKLIGRKVTGNSSSTLEPVEGSEYEMDADLVLVAIGFTQPAEGPLTDDLERTKRGNIADTVFKTSHDGTFVAGDARVGASLIVTAIAEGRRSARSIEKWLRERATTA